MLSFLPFLPPFGGANDLDFGLAALAASAASVLSSSTVSISSLAPAFLAAAAPANAPTVAAPAALAAVSSGSSSPVSSMVSSVSSNPSGPAGISGLLVKVLATCTPAAPASGMRPASDVISTRFLLSASAARLSSFMLTILWKVVARLGSTRATTLPSLLRSLSMIPVISSSIST